MFLLVAGISILSIMMVQVTERTHEINILKSIGFWRRGVVFLFLSEAITIGLAGGSYVLPGLLSAGAKALSQLRHQPRAAMASEAGASLSLEGVGR